MSRFTMCGGASPNLSRRRQAIDLPKSGVKGKEMWPDGQFSQPRATVPECANLAPAIRNPLAVSSVRITRSDNPRGKQLILAV
jgi:hypothetical protein